MLKKWEKSVHFNVAHTPVEPRERFLDNKTFIGIDRQQPQLVYVCSYVIADRHILIDNTLYTHVMSDFFHEWLLLQRNLFTVRCRVEWCDGGAVLTNCLAGCTVTTATSMHCEISNSHNYISTRQRRRLCDGVKDRPVTQVDVQKQGNGGAEEMKSRRKLRLWAQFILGVRLMYDISFMGVYCISTNNLKTYKINPIIFVNIIRLLINKFQTVLYIICFYIHIYLYNFIE